jgi:uncharacterized protein (TIGR00297 family)
MIPPPTIRTPARKKSMTPESQQLEPFTRTLSDSLRWQSRLLCLAVLPLCGAWLVLYTNQFWTPVTLEGLAICAVFGLLVWRLRAATGPAALTGFVLTACMYLATANPVSGSWLQTAFPSGLTLFVLAFLATRFRRESKEHLGIAEARSGRRAAQIVANLGSAALAGIALLSHPIGGMAAMVAALAEATADTISSELGQVLGGTPRLITSLRSVPAGTDGGVSLAGTAAGIVGAMLVVLTAVPTLHLSWRVALVAWSAGIFGLFFDSLLGATLERRGWINNDAVNFLSTLAAALVAAVAAR